MAQIQENNEQLWTRWRSEYGDFESIEVVGSYPARFGAVSLSRVNFVRGSVFIEFTWEESIIGDYRILDSFPTAVFVPITETQFVPSESQQRDRIQLSFDGVSKLLIKTQDMEVVAERVGNPGK